MKKKAVLAFLTIVLITCCFTACTPKSTLKGKNTDKSFSMVTSWTSNGLINHYDSNTYCDAFNFFVVEGLYRYVRSTDEIYCQLAAKMPTHKNSPIEDYKDVMGNDQYEYLVGQGCASVSVTTAIIRDNAKWQNGEDFTAKDVWAYYYLMHPMSSNYMVAVNPVDNKTVEFVWNPLKDPVDSVKELLIAQDKSGTVKYDEFSSYVDPLFNIVMESPVNENIELWGAFNRFSTDEQIVQLNVTRNAFFEYNPSWYIATGPFKLKTFSATEILLTKNEYYWNADNIGFEKIKLYSSNDLNQTYQLVSGGYIDYLDGFIQQDTLESMLDANPDLINLKMYDPGAIGLMFNLENKLLTLKVREAFQYIFDRDAIKDAANPYAETSHYALLGMAPQEAKTYMSEKHFNSVKTYSRNWQKAEEILTEAGWEKHSDGWYADGRMVELNMGTPTADITAISAEAATAQLNAFGIKCNLLKSTNFYSNAVAINSQYDLLIDFCDLNMSFSYPTGSYDQFYNIYSRYIHLDRYPANYPETQKANGLKIEFEGLDEDTKTYAFADHIHSFYSLNKNEMTYLVDVFNTGLAKECLGVQFFQNVTASTINVGRIKNVPLEKYWKENHNVSYVPAYGTEDFYEVAKTNLFFAANYLLAYGVYQPNN